jgi:hypothetical protein
MRTSLGYIVIVVQSLLAFSGCGGNDGKDSPGATPTSHGDAQNKGQVPLGAGESKASGVAGTVINDGKGGVPSTAEPTPGMGGDPGQTSNGMVGNGGGFAKGHAPESYVRPAEDPKGQGGSNNNPEVGPPSAKGEGTPRPSTPPQ